MIFVTVGTQFPFDRLVKKLDNGIFRLLAGHEVFAQIGDSRYCPANFQYSTLLPREEYAARMQSASAIISHAGMGTITMALQYGKPLLVLPRLRRYGEVVNDHQVVIARRFEERGHLLAAYSEDDLETILPQLMTFVPRHRNVNPDAVSDTIAVFLRGVAANA
jgi:beta-1,4-N-acetylglucosaminyltransferase